MTDAFISTYTKYITISKLLLVSLQNIYIQWRISVSVTNYHKADTVFSGCSYNLETIQRNFYQMDVCDELKGC